MGKIIKEIHELVGDTPMLELPGYGPNGNVTIYAKLEFMNPAGSIKDRMGIWLIEKAEEKGLLTKDTPIIEATAGNTGIGLALGALRKGYPLILVVPGKFSVEKKTIMKALGATIIETPTELGLKGAFKEVHRLRRIHKNAFLPSQFTNKHNPEIHAITTAPEIYHALDGNIQAFVCGAGSGGTFTGIMSYLKNKDKNIKGVLADPLGSIIGGGNCHSYAIEGIGNDFIPEVMDRQLIDQVIKVSDEEALEQVRLLAKERGILVGTSSGAAFHSSIKLAQSMDDGNIVTIFADRGDRYISQGLYQE